MGQSKQPIASLPEGCLTQQVERSFDGLFDAVNVGDRKAALRYISPRNELHAFGVSPSPPVGSAGGSSIAQTPSAVYRELSRLARGGRGLSLLAAQVVAPGPLGPQSLSAGRTRLSRKSTAGTDFAIATGSEYGSGKNGINCEKGRFYLWEMALTRKLHPQTLCGVALEPRSIGQLRDKPAICGR